MPEDGNLLSAQPWADLLGRAGNGPQGHHQGFLEVGILVLWGKGLACSQRQHPIPVAAQGRGFVAGQAGFLLNLPIKG